MAKSTKFIRKIVIGLIGFPLLGIGIILIPLPGPGLLVCFVSLLILSTEFEWAKTHFENAKAKIKAIYEKSKRVNK